MARIITLDAQEMASHVTLTIKVKRGRQWQARLAIAIWLMRLAAWIGWLGFEVEETPACAGREEAE